MAAGTTAFGVEPPVHSGVATERRDEVRDQLARIVAHPLFKHSKHYPAFLRHVVEQSLDGHESRLKERSIGVEVFGRDPDYDTNLDPVVRTSACEVRKRIAQYYLEPGHESEIRIEMHSGSYVPDFRFPAAPAETNIVVLEPVAVAAPLEAVHPRTNWRAITIIVAAPLLLLAIAGATLRNPTPPVDQFRAPVWNSANSLMLCMGGSRPPSAVADVPGPGPTVLDVMHGDRLAFADAVTMGRITGLLRASHKRFDIRRGEDFTLTELRNGPVILIGAFNNPWTLRLQETLRFWFEKDPSTGMNYIHDRQKGNQRLWSTNPTMPYAQFTEDYAIISRFANPLTEKIVVIVAGMTKDGTMAAGEFISEPQYLEALARQAPADWQHRNLQVVLRTEVVNGSPGPASIVAAHFW